MSQKVKQKYKVLVVLLMSILMDAISFSIVIPLLPFYANSFGANPFQIGLLMGLFPLIAIFAPLLWGSLSDRIGRRRAFLLNIAGTCLSYLCFSLANSLKILFISRILAGASSASIVIAQSYISDLTTPNVRGKNLGYLQAAAGIGYVLGPTLGGFFTTNDPSETNFQLLGLSATLVCFVTFYFASATLPHSNQTPNVRKSAINLSAKKFFIEVNATFQRPLIGILMILIFTIFFSVMGVQAIFALWCEQQFNFGPKQFNYLIIFYCLISIIVQVGLNNYLLRRFNQINLLLFSLITLALGLFVLPLAHTILQLLGAIVFLIFAQATGYPIITNLLTQLAGKAQIGKTLGLMQSISGLASFLGSIWTAFMFGAIGARWSYWIDGLLIILGVIYTKRYITPVKISKLTDSSV